MRVREALETLERVGEVATLAGIKGGIDEERMHFVMSFGLEGGRSQQVYVRTTAKSAEHKVVTLFSPCLVVKKGLFTSLSKEKAVDLLKRNENMLFARFGIWDSEKETMVVASVDHLLGTLDPEEFRNSALCVAMAADLYEREHGKDSF